MATLAGSTPVPTTGARSSVVIEQLGLVPFALSIALAFDTAAASLASLLVRDAIRGPAVQAALLPTDPDTMARS